MFSGVEGIILSLLITFMLIIIITIFFKKYVYEKVESELLEKVILKKGYKKKKIEDSKILEKINNYTSAKTSIESIDKIEKIIHKDNQYLCRVKQTRTVLSGGYQEDLYTLLVYLKDTNIDYELKIRPKYNYLREERIETSNLIKTTEPKNELMIIFNENFKIYLSKKVYLSQKIQLFLFNEKDQFPLNKDKNRILPIININKNGFSISSTKVKNEEELFYLLDFAQNLKDILYKSND